MRNNGLQVFSFANHEVRTTIGDAGEPLFCASDIARALGYVKPEWAVKVHCQLVPVIRGVIDVLGRKQEAKFIPEADVYRLIMHSRLPSAKRFERWIMEEVLPAIRKTGTYGQAPAIDLRDHRQLVLAAHQLAGMVQELQQQIAFDRPATTLGYRVAESEGEMSLKQALTSLGLPPGRAGVDRLVAKGIGYRIGTGLPHEGRFQPAAEYGETGKKWFTVRPVMIGRTVYPVVRVTAPGLLGLSSVLGSRKAQLALPIKETA